MRGARGESSFGVGGVLKSMRGVKRDESKKEGKYIGLV